MTLAVDVGNGARRASPSQPRFESAGRRHRALRPLRRGQDDARQPHRRAAPAGSTAASSSTATCSSTPARGIDVPTHRRRVGYVFQEGRLFPHLTVRSNLLYGRGSTPRDRALGLASSRSSTCSASAGLLDAAAGTPVRRREAARRDRPGAAREPAPPPHGRAARLARRRPARRRSCPISSACATRCAADRLCQPRDRRGRAARRHAGAAGGRQGPRHRYGQRRARRDSTSCPTPARPKQASSSHAVVLSHVVADADDSSSTTPPGACGCR